MMVTFPTSLSIHQSEFTAIKKTLQPEHEAFVVLSFVLLSLKAYSSPDPYKFPESEETGEKTNNQQY